MQKFIYPPNFSTKKQNVTNKREWEYTKCEIKLSDDLQ